MANSSTTIIWTLLFKSDLWLGVDLKMNNKMAFVLKSLDYKVHLRFHKPKDMLTVLKNYTTFILKLHYKIK